MNTYYLWLFVIVTLITANLPWMTNRILGLFRNPMTPDKPFWLRLIEWLVLYLGIGLVALGLENKLNGAWHQQGWEFYVITLCVFFVLSVPGFIYHYEFRLKRSQHV